MKKLLFGLLFFSILGFTFAQATNVNIAALNGPSGIGMAYLFENHPDLGGATSSFQTVASADVLLPKLLKGEVDIAILPPNAAAKVYTKNKGAIVVGAVVGKGMLSVVSTDKSISSLKSLIGKKVYVAGQGATPEYMIRYLCQQQGISCDGGKNGIELDFSVPTAEIAAAMAGGKIQIALVPEPFATVITMNVKTASKVIDVQTLWNKANYPMTLCVINANFAKNNPKIVEKFLAAYKTSIDWTNANPSLAGSLVEKHTLGLKAPIVAKSIPFSNFEFSYAKDSKKNIEELLSVFLSFAPEAIGGKLPDEGFYFGL